MRSAIVNDNGYLRDSYTAISLNPRVRRERVYVVGPACARARYEISLVPIKRGVYVGLARCFGVMLHAKVHKSRAYAIE